MGKSIIIDPYQSINRKGLNCLLKTITPDRSQTTSVNLFIFLFIAFLIVSCSSLPIESIPTTLPTEYLPTAAALTLSASGALNSLTPQSSPQPLFTAPAELSTELPTISETNVNGLTPSTATKFATDFAENEPELHQPTTTAKIPQPTTEKTQDVNTSTLELTATAFQDTTGRAQSPTPAPPIPEATIQIFELGDLSKVTSPIPISARLTCGQGKTIRFELYGEDGRTLARYMRTYENIPWNAARIGFNMEYEIDSAAELGRLVVSAEDSFGRLIEATSMNLILISQGLNEINPPSGLQQRIIIQDPPEKSLIQTGKLIVSGRAKPASNLPLRAMLVGEDGKILGQRLAGIVMPIPGDYGIFIAEVPYSVKELTPALLMVFEEGGKTSPYTYLSSIEVLLAP